MGCRCDKGLVRSWGKNVLVGTLSLAMVAYPVPLAAEPALAVESDSSEERRDESDQSATEGLGEPAHAGVDGDPAGGGDRQGQVPGPGEGTESAHATHDASAGEGARGVGWVDGREPGNEYGSTDDPRPGEDSDEGRGHGGGVAGPVEAEPEEGDPEEPEPEEDVTPPVASIAFDAEPVPAEGTEGIYAARRTATLTVTDARAVLDPTVALPEGAAGGIEVGEWTSSEDGRSASARVTFLDGTYDSLRVTATDGTNRLDESLALDGFTVDTVAPILASVVVTGRTGAAGAPAQALDLARGGAPEGPLYVQGGQGALRIHVEDAQVGRVEARLGEAPCAARDLGGGDFELDLPEGVSPNLEVWAQDAAGNRSACVAVAEGTLVVDGTAPAIGAVRTSAADRPLLPDEGARLGVGASTLVVEAVDANLVEGAGALGAQVTLRDGTRRNVAVHETAGGEAAAGNRTFELALDDGTYDELVLTVWDKAGNACERAFHDVMVDTVPPRFTIYEDQEIDPSGREGETSYYAWGHPVSVAVAEEGFSEDPAAENYVGSHVTVTNLGEPVDVAWARGKDGTLVGTPEEDGSCDGTYEFAVRGQDLVGNAAVATDGRDSTGRFVVDTTEPQVSVSDVTEGLRRGAGWNDPVPYDYLLQPGARSQTRLGQDLYFRHEVTSLVTLEDANLDLVGSAVNLDGHTLSPARGLASERVQRISDSLWVSWGWAGGRCTCLVTYADDGRGGDDHQTPFALAVDKAGNRHSAGTQTPIVVDSHAPRIRLAWKDDPEVRNTQNGRRYYNAPRSMTATVTDGNWDLSQATGDVVHVTDRDRGQRPPSSWEVRQRGDGDLPGTVSYDATFGDGDYDLWVGAHDLAGNRAEDRATPPFVVDTRAPVIDVSFDNGDACNGRYFAAPRTMTVRVEERNFDPARMWVNVTTSNSDHDGDPAGNIGGPAAWVSEGDVHTLTYAFDRDGTYAVEVGGSDLATNEAEPVRVGEFVIDRTAPEVTVTPERDPDATFAGVGHYRRPLAWTVRIRDRNLDAETATGSRATIGRGRAQVGPVRAWRQERERDGTVTWTTTVLYDELPAAEAGQASLSPEVHAADLAGNVRREEGHPFCVDRTAPSVVLAHVSREPSSFADGKAYQFFGQPTSMTFRFSDPYRLQSAQLFDPEGAYVVREGVVPGSREGTITIDLVDGARSRLDTEYERDITLTLTDIAGNVRVWTIDREGNVADDAGSSPRNVSLDGRGIHPRALVKDTTAPLVSLSGPAAGSFHSAGQTVHVAVDEFNFGYLRRFDPARPVVRVTRREGRSGGGEEVHDVMASQLAGTGAAWACDVQLLEDGHYTLVGSLADIAGNRSNTAVVGEFTVDGTAPVASLAWDNTDVRNGRYYNAARTATLTVVEHNFDASLMSVSTTGEVGPWSHDGDTHTCAIRFGEGVHRLEVTGSDLAGNAANKLAEPEFVVDTTAPTIAFGGVAERRGGPGGAGAYEGVPQDHSAYNGVVAPQVFFSDEANFDGESVSFALVGGKLGEVTDAYAHSASSRNGGETVQYADLGRRTEADGVPYDIDADDVYVLRARVADLAGNTDEAELTFSVNRFGSNYLVSMDGGGEGSRGGLLTEAPGIRVREINVCGAVPEGGHAVLKEYADATTPIERREGGGTGYGLAALSPHEAENAFGWAEYLYTIRSGNFGEGSDSDHGDGGQGVYRVDVTSDDAASNANTTAGFWGSDARRQTAEAKRATAQFTLDQRAPQIEGINVPGPLALGRSCEGSFRVSDAITCGNEVEVTVGGRRVETVGPSDGRGTFTFCIPALPLAAREVRIRVRDYAGRTVEASGGRVIVTDLVPESLVAAAVGGAAAGLAVGRSHRARARRGAGASGEGRR